MKITFSNLMHMGLSMPRVSLRKSLMGLRMPGVSLKMPGLD